MQASHLGQLTSQARDRLFDLSCLIWVWSGRWRKGRGKVHMSFSPQPSAAVEANDGSYNIYQENTEYSLAKNYEFL